MLASVLAALAAAPPGAPAAAPASLAREVSSPTVPARDEPPEMRGLWVVRTAMTTPEGIDEALDRATAAGLNTVFVQVRGRADAFYRSRLVPRSVLLERQPASFDPLAHALAGARRRGLRVHAWFNLMIAAGHGAPLPPGHVLRLHPDWVMVPRGLGEQARRLDGAATLRLVQRAGPAGDAEGLYLSPFAPGVGQHLEGAVRELARGYAVDGLHFDFVRYPGPDFDFSRWAHHAWREAGGRQPPWSADVRSSPAWTSLRQRALTSLVQRLGAAARAERPGLALTAAVIPEESLAVGQRFQDWPAWVRRGLLDAVCPMAYAPEREVFTAQVVRARELVGGPRVWAGIGAWRLDVPRTLDRVRQARSAGVGGFVIFSHEWLAGEDPRRLRAGIDAPPAGHGRAGGR